MSSTFIERSPERDGDKSLILIMDGEGNVTTDPANFEKLLSTQKLPEMGIKIVRLDSNQTENGNEGDNDSKQELNLTVEEIYPETLTVTTRESTVDGISSPLEILPGPSNENLNHEMVDPFSEMDPEQLQRLEHALASEQAKQILGENVAAMLDMLSVDDNPAAFLQNTIKNDHCYTNLLPSSDPNGPSFFMNDTRANGESSKGKGKARAGTPIKGKKVIPAAVIGPVGTLVKRAVIKDGQVALKNQQNKQTTLLDYNISAGPTQTKPQNEVEDSAYDEDVDVEDSDGSSGVDDDNLSDEDYNNRSTKTKRKSRKHKRKLLMKKNAPGRPFGRPMRPGSRFGRRSTTAPDVKVRNEKLDDAMSKIVQSLDYDSKDGDEKLDFKRGARKLKTYKSKHSKEELSIESEKVVKDVPKPIEDSMSPSKAQQAKYPKRENRKPPAHLAESLGPALFSTPDIIRRISTSEEVPQTPPEKKNFTVGVYSNPKLGEKVVIKTTPTKTEMGLSESFNHVKEKEKMLPKELSKEPKFIKNETGEMIKARRDSREEKIGGQKSPGGSGDGNKKANLEIQKLIEKHQIKQALYDEPEDYSDENVEENYYLDPTQMDQSLLEGFNQAATKSEDQLLQEAILLQEQLIESNKEMSMTEASNVGIEDAQVEMPFEPETIEDIQNEITSAILVAQEEVRTEAKQNYQIDLGAKKNVFTNETNRVTRIGDTNSNEIDGVIEDEEGNLIVDENRLEDRKRNSAKRRRSDEVSDLDSDLDDALSEASWNSEDDPDRLWCICRKPHNNRFMICCDVCEEWFHGKCVGITKTIGKQMEQDGLEWSCPNCTKKKKMEEHEKEVEKIKALKEKMAQSIREQQQKIREKQKIQGFGGKDKSIKSPKSGSSAMKQTKISDFSHTSSQGSEEEETVGRKCIMCKGPVRENSIYCSDDCIRKHSQHAISQLMADANKKSSSESSGTGQGDNFKVIQKVKKEESRIVVMDSNSKKFLVGQNAPTAANLTTWLKENPSYHVVYKKTDKPGKLLLTSRKVVKVQSKPGETQKVFVQKVSDSVKSTQLKLAVSPNSKQINILQPSAVAGKKIFQIVQTSAGGKQTAFVVKPKQDLVGKSKPIEGFPLSGIKTVVSKDSAPVRVREVTSPKMSTTPAGKESSVQKVDKIQKKKKDRMQRSSTSSASGKESKTGQWAKQEDGKDKEKDKKDTDQQIRDSVKKTLAETLKTRVQECKDLEYNQEHIEGLAFKIEEKLYKHFECKVDTKYKSKYRSLVFNIKDPKNETLYKKIVDNSISPKELVKLSPDELASQELARWREKENQHQLEMIKKTELELMTKGNTYIMKSHKGEQVIESDQSEKVAAVAAEIDPNTPAQELVSALNSVTSTTQDANEEEEKSKETSLMRLKRKEKERKRSRDRKHDRRDKEKRRSSSRSSRSRSHHSKDKKRSRSRDRDRDRSRHRHRDRKSEKKRERDSKEGSESVEEKPEEKVLKNELSVLEEIDDKTTKKSVEDDEADREPSSTVIIKTPDINLEELEPIPLWKGSIVMADVAKFNGFATEISGDCGGLSVDIGDKVEIVGRIPFNTVWDYIARMKKMGTKDILVIKIVPVKDEEKGSYETLYNYLSKRSRIGVIGKTSEAVKDFYLYPLASHTHLPQVLLPLEGRPFEGDGENILLGIIVRNKHKSKHLRTSSVDSIHLQNVRATRKVEKIATVEEELLSHRPEKVPDRSYTPPLPDKEQEDLLRKERQKRKIRCRVEFKETLTNEEDEEAMEVDDDDSPYSPGDSDEDLAPLPKIAKTSIPSMSTISKLLSPGMPSAADSNLQDPIEIQRKIEEMNRAIEEQTQQIQSLTSAVPKLGVGTVLPSLPLLASVTSAIVTPALSPSSVPLPSSGSPQTSHAPVTIPAIPSPTEKVQLPLISEEIEEEKSPPRSFTPPLKVQEKIPFLPEVTSKIALPSNLQEILNAVQQKKSDETEPRTREVSKSVEEIMKNKNPDIDIALNVLNQTKSLLSSLTGGNASDGSGGSQGKEEEKSGESQAILSRLTDQELLQKVQEMEMETAAENAALLHSINPCPPQPLPPGIQDIPLLPPGEPFSNPRAPPFFTNPLISSGPIVQPGVVKSLTANSEAKKPDKRIKLDPKSVFENQGVPDFVNIPGSNWDEKRGVKNFKIDIKLAMNALEKKTIDMDHFDIESISKMQETQELSPSPKSPIPSGSGISEKKLYDDTKYDSGGERSSKTEYRSSHDRNRRRSDERKGSDWKYERRHWDDSRRHKDDYRRHGRRDRPQKFRKDRFDDRRNRHLQKDWDGSIKNFEERQRWRNQDIRRDEMRRPRKRSSDSFTN